MSIYLVLKNELLPKLLSYKISTFKICGSKNIEPLQKKMIRPLNPNAQNAYT